MAKEAKGKGKKGKGKGKTGKCKGKGKGNDPPQAYRPPEGKGQVVETRQCYNCLECGHLGKDCKHADRRKAAARRLEEVESQGGSQSGSVRSLASAQGGMKRLCMMRVTDADGWTTKTRSPVLSHNLKKYRNLVQKFVQSCRHRLYIYRFNVSSIG